MQLTNAVASPSCLHCNSPLLRAEDQFCCAGCRFVYHSIVGHGLQSYYKMLSNSGSALKPASVAPSRFEYAATKEFIDSFTVPGQPGQRILTLFLDGVHCAACVWILERIPELLPGALSAELRFARAELTVAYDAGVTDPAKILGCVNSLGYKPTPIRLQAGEIARARSNRIFLMRIGVAAVCAMNIMMLAVSLYQGAWTGIEAEYSTLFSWVSLLLCAPVVMFSAVPLYRTALGGLRSGVLHIDLPLSVAIIAGFVLSAANTVRGDPDIYYDSVSALVVLLLIGRWVQHRTIERATDPHALLYAVVPRFAQRGGKEVFIEALSVGDTISVITGDTLAADGEIAAGAAELSTAFLTGESRPHRYSIGDQVFAGSKVIAGAADIHITALGEATRVGKVMQAVEEAARTKAPLVLFLDRCSRRFTAVVLILALFTFVFWAQYDLAAAFKNSIALLVVTCPCVLAFATPLIFSLSISRAAKRGILFKSSEAIERAAALSSVVFDKTGTLTKGELALQSITHVGENSSPRPLQPGSLSAAAPSLAAAVLSLEEGIEHPVASALRAALAADASDAAPGAIQNREILTARGVTGFWNGRRAAVGSTKFVLPLLSAGAGAQASEIAREILARGSTPVAAALGDSSALVFEFRDPLRPEAKKVVRELRDLGLSTYILSGDHREVVDTIASEAGIDGSRAFAERSPEGKMEAVAEVEKTGSAAMVGDGVNDAAAWKAASVGIGLHGGAELSLKVTDVYLTHQDLTLVTELVVGSRKTIATVKRSLCVSALYNAIGAAAAITGAIGPLGAAILMPLSSLTVIINALTSRNFRT